MGERNKLPLHQNMATPVAKAIRKYRIEAGLTQAELAAKIGVNEKTVRGWELEKQQPKTEAILKLASVFRISPLSLYKTQTGDPAGCMHALFRMEDQYGLIPELTDEGLLLKFPETRKSNTQVLKRMLKTWNKARTAFDNKLISKREYESWKARYPDYSTISPSTGLPIVHKTPIGQTIDAVKKHTEKHNY